MRLGNMAASSTIVVALFSGCEERRDSAPPPAPAASTSRATDPPPRAAAPDNTAVNKADLNTDAKNPIDQSNAKSDIDITAAIRRAIMEDKSLSINAQNCKIVTANGVITLRGPVESQAEKESIEAKAKAVQGALRIDNQLEVKVK